MNNSVRIGDDAEEKAPCESVSQELIAAERRGWEALCSDEASSYYEDHLTDDALMAFPFGVLDREQALTAMAAAERWSRFHMADPQVIPLGPDAGVVVYAVTAQRAEREPFSAIVSSTFVRSGENWKLAFHQQSFASPAGSEESPPQIRGGGTGVRKPLA
jgi:hypothetical protein